jgi:tRNA/tmRNA/rRNA uracil-C5-methylase (TrmA/RlmC/RlmD family)
MCGGGCQHQHIAFERQRNMKTVQVQKLFKQLGGMLPHRFPPPVLDTIGTDKVFGYRSKITLLKMCRRQTRRQKEHRAGVMKR